LLVEPDAANLQRGGRIAQISQRYAGQPDIDSHAVHMQAVLGHAAAPRVAQTGVGGRAAIAGNDLERGVCLKLPSQREKQAEKLGSIVPTEPE
jgi:hypothetical protein